MKIVVAIATGILVVLSVAAQNLGTKDNIYTESILFTSAPWNDILTAAQKENKPIFLNISASWCGYCERMKANVFTDSTVASYYNSNFINVSVDGEKGEGIELAKKYGVKGYPTYVFINPNGELIMKESGYKSPLQFMELGKTITNKLK